MKVIHNLKNKTIRRKDDLRVEQPFLSLHRFENANQYEQAFICKEGAQNNPWGIISDDPKIHGW